MRPLDTERVVLFEVPEPVRRSLRDLLFVPPLRFDAAGDAPELREDPSQPLLYLVGRVPRLEAPGALEAWLDRLAANGGAPVALLYPRDGHHWCAAAAHPQFCGLLPWEHRLEVGALERVLHAARRFHARRRVRAFRRRARLRWSVATAEAADTERVWLHLESILHGLLGPRAELARIGMAFSEALTNAVEHGNLELGSSLKDDGPEGMARFFEERARRLLDPRFRRRRMHLEVRLHGSRLRIRLRNEGARFDPEQVRDRACAVRIASPYGLGLAMIRNLVDAVALSRDGRTLTLTHRLRVAPSDPRGLDLESANAEERPAA